MTADEWLRAVRGYKGLFEGAILVPLADFAARIPHVRRWAYAQLGASPAASIVLADLQRFCHARDDQTTHVLDDPSGRESAALEARRQVYLRISGNLGLTPLEIAEILKHEENFDTED